MSGHTPGPWGAELSPYRGTLSVVSETTWICGELLNPSTMPEEEAWANARLIAAAPELLEALKGAVAAWETFYPLFPVNRDIEDAEFNQLNKARAAISKAEGRS